MRFVAAFFLTLLLFSAAAFADEYWSFVQVNCIPSMRYFSVKAFSANDLFGLTGPDSKDLENVEKSDGIYLLSRFAERKEPVTCEIMRYKEKHIITVKLGSYHAPQATGICGGAETGALVVTVDGKLEERMSVGGGCDEHEVTRDNISVNFGDGLLEHCQEHAGFFIPPGKDFSPNKEECKSVEILQKEKNLKWLLCAGEYGAASCQNMKDKNPAGAPP